MASIEFEWSDEQRALRRELAADQHPERPDQDHHARGEPVTLNAGNVEHRRGEGRDHDPEAEAGEDQHQVGLAQRSQVAAELVRIPSGKAPVNCH